MLAIIGKTSTDKLSPAQGAHRIRVSWQSYKLYPKLRPFGWRYDAPDSQIGQWWQSIGKDRRTAFKVRYAVIQDHAPKHLTDDQKTLWWEKLGKKKRVQLRDGYEANTFLEDVGDFASKAIDIATLAPLVKKIPVLKDIHKATTSLHKLPINAVTQLAAGKRIDQVALSQFKTALSSVKTLAPYIQTVISFVPGIGTGLSAGIGGALALASGKPIDQAFIAALRSAVPGGPIAQAAFDVAAAVVEGKPVDAVLLNALPVAPAAKAALVRGAAAARALADGKRVDQVLLDQALQALPPAAAKAAQIGVAVASAKNIQDGLRAGVAASAKSLVSRAAAGNPTAQKAIQAVTASARAGVPRAQQLAQVLALANRVRRAVPAGVPKVNGEWLQTSAGAVFVPHAYAATAGALRLRLVPRAMTAGAAGVELPALTMREGIRLVTS